MISKMSGQCRNKRIVEMAGLEARAVAQNALYFGRRRKVIGR